MYKDAGDTLEGFHPEGKLLSQILTIGGQNHFRLINGIIAVMEIISRPYLLCCKTNFRFIFQLVVQCMNCKIDQQRLLAWLICYGPSDYYRQN